MVQFTGKDLLLGTRNDGKISELTTLLKHKGLNLRTAKDLSIPEPEENGQSFQENALIKAQTYVRAAGIPVLTDDSGLCITALNGFPGIHTAPFARQQGGHTQAILELEKRLKDQDKSACFHSCIVLMLPGGDYQVFEAQVNGHLVFPSRGILGWGFDPIFIPEGEKRTYGEMQPSEKLLVEHRIKALNKLLEACFN